MPSPTEPTCRDPPGRTPQAPHEEGGQERRGVAGRLCAYWACWVCLVTVFYPSFEFIVFPKLIWVLFSTSSLTLLAAFQK